MEIEPLDDKVLIAVEPRAEAVGRIILHRDEQYAAREGIVRALGPDVSVAVAVGDRVRFEPFTGQPLQETPGGQDYILAPQDQLQAVLT